MDKFEEAMNDIFEIEYIDKTIFKSIKINPDKTIYFAFRESQRIMLEKLTSVDLTPICFILEMDGQYYYCPLNDEEIDQKVIKEFVLKFIS